MRGFFTPGDKVSYEVVVGEASCQISPYTQDGVKADTKQKVRVLSHVYVPKEHRRKGYASKLLDHVGRECDSAQLALIVEPKAYDDGEMDGKDLIAFYKKHGFIELQKDPYLMVRIPVPPMLAMHVKKTHDAVSQIYLPN
jgi:GNAT superfamily N-acetyltransferase